MGFIYNNYWEALCRTYLELNGFFVMSNVFVSLFVPGHAGASADANRREAGEPRLEADLIAFKTETTDLSQFGLYLDCPPHLDRDPSPDEFLAGEQGKSRLVYCEVRAYLQSPCDGLADHFKEEANIRDKIKRIGERFQTPPEVVLIGHGITDLSKERIRERAWKYKELQDIFWFVADRFDHHREKLAVPFNDPCLEVMRGFFGPAPLAELKRTKS